VQTLAGVLLPSATVFLLLLCNDKAVLGPWVNSRALNLFTGTVIAVLVMLSMILTLSVLFAGITGTQIVTILVAGSIVGIVAAVGVGLAQYKHRSGVAACRDREGRERDLERMTWRMAPLDELPAGELSTASRTWLIVLRLYLVVAAGLVLTRIVMLAVGAA
jgi:hypothetical protein